MVQLIKTNLINRAQTNIEYSSAPTYVNIQMPTAQRNYAIFDQNKVNSFVSQRENALPYLKQVLQTSQDEKQIVEALYIVDRMIDAGVKGIPAMYPVFSRFNNTKSPHIQTFLAGIYRKTQVPDAFGPLVKMLIQNSIKNPSPPTPLPQGARVVPTSLLPIIAQSYSSQLTAHGSFFDPNEEIGGAILSYISTYSKGAPKIDYQA